MVGGGVGRDRARRPVGSPLIEVRSTILAMLTTPRAVALLALIWVAIVTFVWFAWSLVDAWI